MAAKKNFPLRINSKLYEVLERWAADEFRSVNSHIEFLLRESAQRSGRLRPDEEHQEEEKAIKGSQAAKSPILRIEP